MLNRFLSMNVALLPIVASIQQYTVGVLSNEMVYRMYYDILPDTYMPMKYIKGEASEKYNPDLIRLLGEHLQVGKSDAIDALEAIINLPNGKAMIVNLLESYGTSPEQIKKLTP